MLLSIFICIILISPREDSLLDKQPEKYSRDESLHSFDSLNTSFVANWPFGISWTVTCDETRYITFLGSGGGLYILDVSNPSNIVNICDPIRTRGILNNLYYDLTNRRLYIAASIGGLEIWNFDTPNNPLKISLYNTPSVVCGVFIEGHYAYLACGSEGLRILDISDPANPLEVGSCYTPDSALDVWVQDSFVYVADAEQNYNGGGLVIINISTPSNPFIVGYCSTPNFAEDLQVNGSYAFVCDGEPEVGGLRIIDISNPSNPQEVAVYRPDTASWLTICPGVCIRDTIAYISYHTAGLRIVNIADPTAPIEIGYYYTPGHPFETYVSDSIAYIADDKAGMSIVDVSSYTNPFEIGHYGVPDWANFVYTCDTLLFASYGDEGLVRIFNISNPTVPYPISQFSTTYGADGILISNSYAYTTDWNGLCIFDVSEPLNPQMIGFCDLGGYPSGVFLVDSFAYVASFFSGLYIINVADPANPFTVGYCNTPYTANDVEVVDSFAYVADYDDGLQIINVANPTNPQLISSCNTIAAMICVRDTLIYAAALDSGLRIINVSNPLLPHEIGCFNAQKVTDICNFGNYTYINDVLFGLRVINTSNPYAPFETGYYKIPYLFLGRLSVLEPYVYMSSSVAGLQIFEFFPQNVEEMNNQQVLFRISIMPNPIRNLRLRLQIQSLPNETLRFSIYNSVGQRLQTLSQKLGSSLMHHIEIPVNNLAAGVYFLETRTRFDQDLDKFIIIK